jgi:hypothetical protein
VTLTHEMEGDTSRTLLSEAALLAAATRLCIARSMTLLTRAALEKIRPAYSDEPAVSAVMRKPAHPSSVPPV